MALGFLLGRRLARSITAPALLALTLSIVPGPFAAAMARSAPSSAQQGAGEPSSLLKRLLYGVRPGVTLDGKPVGLKTAHEVHALLVARARKGDRLAVNATVDHATGRILPERDGIRLDVAATEDAVRRARPYAAVRSRWVPVRARWRYEDIARLTETIGSYTTWIDGTTDRRWNIVLSSRRIDRTVLYPGDSFSFVATVGTLSRRLGYRLAPTIQDGEMRPGLGGGLCQVSSTLYNAARRAGLRILERHHHALPVHYVPRGMDATVVVPVDPPIPGMPILDLRFQNTRPTPVILHEVVNGWKLTAWVEATGARTLSTRPQSRV